MKLIGSKTEQDFSESLTKGHDALFKEGRNERVLHILKREFPSLKTAYIIGHTPEQYEDFYEILINTDTIAHVEISHDERVEPIIETMSMKDRMIELSKMDQIKLAVAMDLAHKYKRNVVINIELGSTKNE